MKILRSLMSAVIINMLMTQTTLGITARPQKIAALNWTQAEMLLTLGITPAGVTSIKGYQQWQSNNPPLSGQEVELGHRAEPSLEALAALQPDLILGYRWRHNRIYSRLNRIASTVLYQQYPSPEDNRDYYVRMQEIFLDVARLVNKESLAQQKTDEMRRTIASARKRISDAGLASQPVVVGKFVGMGLGLRVYGHRSLVGAMTRELGLNNVWSDTLPGRDFTHVDLLKLTTIGDASLIILGGDASLSSDMIRSPVWQSIPAVKEGRVYYLPALWSFGGPLSAMRMAETIASHLAEVES